MSSELENAQRVLEQNEDILAAIVENLQLGRLNDCMQHYAILQANLVSLATHLDNFPADESDPYTKLNMFPDEIMRKDLLEDLRPAGSKPLPKAPNVPPCADCLAKKNSAMMCRGTLKHIDPSGKYSAIEREEFYNVTQLLSARPTPTNQDYPGLKRRSYKVWAPFEKYTLLVGISLFGTETSKLCQILEDRNAEQIRNYIVKKLKKGDKWVMHFNAVDLMNHRPNGYQPPPLLAPYFAAHALGLDPESVQEDGIVPTMVAQNTDPTATTATESLLAPEMGKPDFNLMLAIAAGVSTHNPHELSTRVPLLPENYMEITGEDSVEDMEVENHTSTSFPRSAVTGVRPAIVYPNGNNGTNGNDNCNDRASTTGPSASGAARRVHWDEADVNRDTDNADPNDNFTSYASYEASNAPSSNHLAHNNNNTGTTLITSNMNANMNLNMNTSGNLLPSLRDPSVVSSLPPLPSGPPPTLRDPLKNNPTGAALNTQDIAQSGSSLSYYAQQQLQADAAKQAQQKQIEEELKLEKKRREESALLGLDAYNLEYARRLQAANIPFKMTSGSAVVVVKGDGIQTTTNSNKNQPPPFARPGMQRMKKQQAAARQQELQELQQATAALPAPLQSSLLLQDPQQLMLQPQTLQTLQHATMPMSMFGMPMPPHGLMQPMSSMPHNNSLTNVNTMNNMNTMHTMNNINSMNNMVNPHNLNNVNNNNAHKVVPEKRQIHHMTAGVYSELPPGAPTYPIQPVSTAGPTVSFSDESFAARLQEALRPRANNHNNVNNANKSKNKSKTGTNSGSHKQLLSQPIGLQTDQPGSSGSNNNHNYNHNHNNNSSSNNESAQPSLFHHILSGTNINPPNKANHKNKSRQNTDATSSTNAAHSSAALDVSMSGYEEDPNNSNLHSPPNMYSDQMILATSEDLSGMQDFGCEFSFL